MLHLCAGYNVLDTFLGALLLILDQSGLTQVPLTSPSLRWSLPTPPPPHARLATSVCQLRHDRMGHGPTEPHAGRGTFLLSSGGAGGGYY